TAGPESDSHAATAAAEAAPVTGEQAAGAPANAEAAALDLEIAQDMAILDAIAVEKAKPDFADYGAGTPGSTEPDVAESNLTEPDMIESELAYLRPAAPPRGIETGERGEIEPAGMAAAATEPAALAAGIFMTPEPVKSSAPSL